MDTYLNDKHYQCLMSDQDVKRVLTFCEPIDVGILYDPIKDNFLPKLQLDRRLVNPIKTTRKESKVSIKFFNVFATNLFSRRISHCFITTQSVIDSIN
jgi:hypothetical protein